MRSRTPRFIAAVLLAVAVPVAAFALVTVIGQYSDINEAGILPASPVSDKLDVVNDSDRVFKITLQKDQYFYAGLTGASGTDFDLYLYGPSTGSVAGTEAAVAYSETAGTSTERIVHKATVAGTYYVNVWAFNGAGTYALTHGFPTIGTGINGVAPVACAWGASPRVSGRLRNGSGQPVVGQTVTIFAKPYGATGFKPVAGGTTDASGNFSIAVKPTSGTLYSARFLGSPTHLPSAAPTDAKITPYAYLTVPTAKTRVARGAGFTLSGYIKPRHLAGKKNVKLSFQRLENGTWRWRKFTYATNANYLAYTKYSVRTTLPYKGKWRVMASTTADGAHLATKTGWRYINVY